jgi:hypothetical protein
MDGQEIPHGGCKVPQKGSKNRNGRLCSGGWRPEITPEFSKLGLLRLGGRISPSLCWSDDHLGAAWLVDGISFHLLHHFPYAPLYLPIFLSTVVISLLFAVGCE